MNDKGGVLGRKLELVVYDDASDVTSAARLYERLITQDKVDLVLGPYASAITEAAADVTERHRMPMVAPGGTASSIYRKGRKFIFSTNPPGEVFLEGLIDLAVKRGLRTLALINGDFLFGRAVAQGAVELARKRGLQVLLAETYPRGGTDFSAILTRVRAANPDVLGGATTFEGAVAITRQMKALNVNPRMVGLTVGADLPKFHGVLGPDAEFVYGPSLWVPELVDVRAGGLIPVARQYPGAREFVEAYRREFPGADLADNAAAGYGGCQVLVEAVRRAGSLDRDNLRNAILAMDHNTVFGAFRVDRDGLQVGHRLLLFQWQDGKRVIVWPGELAAGQARFPTPPWNQRP
jgi:branched-chain amino acid transport system substrate-binding protein